MAEGAPLLREYGLTPIEGSNPSLSAKPTGPAKAGLVGLAVKKEGRTLDREIWVRPIGEVDWVCEAKAAQPEG